MILGSGAVFHISRCANPMGPLYLDNRKFAAAS
jgi:hypothetical protein